MARILPPWIHRPHSVFTDRRGASQGNDSPNHKQYNNYEWTQYRERFFSIEANIHCACGCGRLANVVDHIIPFNRGGSFWDTRNHQGLANICHNRKSGRERHGKIERYINTKYGKIPERRQHLPLVLGNQSSRSY